MVTSLNRDSIDRLYDVDVNESSMQSIERWTTFVFRAIKARHTFTFKDNRSYMIQIR